MADGIPIFPKAGSFFLHTGNIVNWSRLKRKPMQSPVEELRDCLSSTLGKWMEKQNKDDLQSVTELRCTDNQLIDKVPEDTRETFKVTVKIFLSSSSIEALEDAVNAVLTELGVQNIDWVLITFPERGQQKLSLDDMKPLWEKMADLLKQDKIRSIGVCDLNKDQLEELYNWAEVKPCINQVNLASCCTMPQDLTEYAKENDINLLTHNDPKEILSNESFQNVIGNNCTQTDAKNWQPSWIVRYSILVKCRGIIQTKGYIMRAERDIKKRP